MNARPKSSRLKSVLIVSEFEDGWVEVVELAEGADITVQVQRPEPADFWYWYPERYVYQRPTYTFTVKPGSGDHLFKVTQFERKPGRRLAWAIRRLLGGEA